MYLNSPLASPPKVRAPQIKILPLRLRIQLIPWGFNPACLDLLILYFKPIAPKIASLPGALKTPLCVSTRA